MDRAARHNRRQAKADRRRKRIANGKRRHSPMRGMQRTARTLQAETNLDNLLALTGTQRSNLRIFQIRKPRLRHIPAGRHLEPSVVEKMVGR